MIMTLQQQTTLPWSQGTYRLRGREKKSSNQSQRVLMTQKIPIPSQKQILNQNKMKRKSITNLYHQIQYHFRPHNQKLLKMFQKQPMKSKHMDEVSIEDQN